MKLGPRLAAVSLRAWTVAGVLVILAGVGLRVRAYEINLSLWLDESSLALNLLTRGYSELVRPLTYYQAAPLFFLWLEKLVLVVSHSASEFALRFIPVLGGCAACVTFWLLCRRFRLSAPAVIFATALFSLSGELIDYSVQAKQYSTDVFAALAIYLTAARFLSDKSRKSAFFYCLVGVLAPGLSHPSAFILAGVGVTILIDAGRRRDRPLLLMQLGIAGIWLIGFCINFFFFLRHVSNIPGMLEFWQRHQAFMPLSGGAFQWLRAACLDLSRMAGYPAILLLPAVAVGAGLLWRKDWRVPAMLFVPLILAILASGARQYPFAQRMMLFAAPALLVPAGVGFASSLSFASRFIRPVMPLLFLFAIASPVRSGLARFTHPERFGRQEFRDTFLQAANSGRCSEHMFVYESAANHYRYYNRFRWAGRYVAPLVFLSDITGGPADKTPRMPGLGVQGYLSSPSDHDPSYFDGPPCFWLVETEVTDSESALIHQAIAALGYRQSSTIRKIGASGYLFSRPPISLTP